MLKMHISFLIGIFQGEDDDDDEGWITPKNFAQKRLEMFGVEANKEREEVKVACMTTDFAMQVRH